MSDTTQPDPAKRFASEHLVRALNEAANELEGRAAGLKRFAALIQTETDADPSLEQYANSALVSNVVREFVDAMRQNHTHTLPLIVGYANTLVHGRP